MLLLIMLYIKFLLKNSRQFFLKKKNSFDAFSKKAQDYFFSKKNIKIKDTY